MAKMQSLTRAALCVALFIGAHLAGFHVQAGKPGSVNDAGALEVRIDGPVFSQPDFTGRAGPEFESDLCRTVGLKGTGALDIALRKTWLSIPFQIGTCVTPGLYRRASGLHFASNPAAAGSPVRFNIWLEKNYEMAVAGVIDSGQWPPAPGEFVIIRIPPGVAWEFTPYGGISKSCKAARTLIEDVFIYIYRNPARTANVCDCPFDYTDDNFDGVADECD